MPVHTSKDNRQVEKIGPILRADRLQAGLKQGDVALAASLTVWRLLRVEKGLAEPAPFETLRIRSAIRRLAEVEERRQAVLAGRS